MSQITDEEKEIVNTMYSKLTLAEKVKCMRAKKKIVDIVLIEEPQVGGMALALASIGIDEIIHKKEKNGHN